MPKVNVIIPTYNRARYIGESIESVLAQTFADFQLIIIDDGSEDETREIVERYRSDDRVRYEFQTNHGRSIARNRGIEHARCEWIVFLDSDDQLTPRALEMFISHSSQHPKADTIVARAEFIDDDGRSMASPYAENVGKTARGFIEKPYLQALREVFFSPGSFMVRSGLLHEHNIRFDPELNAAEDLDFAFQIAAHGSILDVTDVVQRYRFHETNTSKAAVRRSAIDVARKHLAEVVPRFPAAEQQAAIARLEINIADYHFLLGENAKALPFYLKSVLHDPSLARSSNVLRQIVSSSIPGGLLKYFRYLKRGETEN